MSGPKITPPPQAANLGLIPDDPGMPGLIPDSPEETGGSPGLIPDPSQNLVSPANEMVSVPSDKVQAALQQGYRLPTPDDLKRQKQEEQYGGAAGAAGAFAEGALNAATFGTGTAALRAADITSKEGEQARAELHPVAHGLGTATGIIAPLVATGGAAGPAEAAVEAGASAVGRAAEMTAPSLIARAGRAAAGAVGGGSLTRAAAMGATEGVLYSGADITEKALIGDPELTWEKAATELGAGGLFGGVLGAGTDFALRGLGKALAGATKGFESVAQKIATGDSATVRLMFRGKSAIEELEHVAPGATEAISASSPETAAFIIKNTPRILEMEQNFPGLTDILARAEPDTASDILKNWNKLLRDPQRRIEVGQALLDSTQKTYSTIEEALGTFNREIRPEEAESLLFGPHTVELPGGGSALEHITPEEAMTEAHRVLNRIGEKIMEMKGEPDLFNPSYTRQLELFHEGLSRRIAEDASPSNIFQNLRLLRQQIDGKIPWTANVPDLGARNAIGAFKDMRTLVKNSITGPAWGEAGIRQKALDSVYSVYFDARKALLSKLGEGEGTAKTISPTKVNAWVNAMADMRGKVKTDAFTNFAEASKNLAAEMERSGFKEAPAVASKINDVLDQAKDIRDKAIITQIVRLLSEKGPLGSGPALPPGASVALAAARKIPGGTGHMVGAITGTINKVRDPSATVKVASFMERLSRQASEKLNQAADSLFSSGAPGAAGGQAGERFAHGGVVGGYSDAARALRRHSSDLDSTAAHVAQETSLLRDHAPATADAAHDFAARLVGHLASKLPITDDPAPLDEPYEPSPTELAEFNRHREVAVRGPVAVLEHARDGTLHENHVETSQAVYPKLHAATVSHLADKLAAHIAAGRRVPRELRGPLGLLLGSELEHAHSGEGVLSAQTALASDAQQQQPPPTGKGPGKPREVETKGAERLATGSQSTALHMAERT